MEVLIFVLISAIFLLVLILLASTGQHSDSSRDVQATGHNRLEERVERLIGVLNYGDEKTSAEAMRNLLSMGPGILPILLKCLSRIDLNPDTVSPKCQLRLEELLIDFGLQTYLQCGDNIRSTHRFSPVFPAVHRVLLGIGPNLLIEFIRGPLIDPVGFMAPLFYRLEDAIEQPLLELLENCPRDIPDELLLAATPNFVTSPKLLERLFSKASPDGQKTLLRVLLPWLPSQCLPLVDCSSQAHDPLLVLMESILLKHDQATLSRFILNLINDGRINASSPLLLLAAAFDKPHQTSILFAARCLLCPQEADTLDDFLDTTAEPRQQVELALSWTSKALSERPFSRLLGFLWLADHNDDPRAAEKLRSIAEDTADPLGAIALALLSHTDHVEGSLVSRFRASNITPIELFFLRFTVLRHHERLAVTLFRLLRSDASRLSALAALTLTSTPYPIANVLKALGRHKGTSFEIKIAPLLWRRWPSCRDEVKLNLTSDDREIRDAAINTIGSFGDPELSDPLLLNIDASSESVEARLNAVELIAKNNFRAISECIERDPEFAKSFSLERRKELLLRLEP